MNFQIHRVSCAGLDLPYTVYGGLNIEGLRLKRAGLGCCPRWPKYTTLSSHISVVGVFLEYMLYLGKAAPPQLSIMLLLCIA